MSNFKWGFVFSISALVISVALGFFSGVSLFHIFIRSIIFAVVFFGLGTGIRIIINAYFPELLIFDEETEPPITFGQPEPGSHINITLGTSGDYALPELYRSNDEKELGNIEDLIAGIFKPRMKGNIFEGPRASSDDSKSRSDFPKAGSDEPDNLKWSNPLPPIDRNEEDDYNDQKGSGEPENFQFKEFQNTPSFETAAPLKPAFAPSFGDDSEGLGGLPDLDTMAMAFSSNFSGEPAPVQPQQHSASFEEAEPVRYNKGNKAQPLEGDFNPKELAEGIRTVLSKDK